MNTVVKLFISLLLIGCSLTSFGLTTSGQESSRPLRVGVVIGAPFASDKQGGFEGLSVALWKEIAGANQWNYQFLATSPDIQESIKQLQAGYYDVLIGPIAVNYQRLSSVDFSRPFFINTIGFILPVQHERLIDLVSVFFSKTFAVLLLTLIVSFVLYLHLFWHFEHGKHPDVPHSYREAIVGSLWGQVFKKGFSGIPTTAGGKITLFVWIFGIGLLLSTFNANLTASFTMLKSKHHDSINSFNDLTQMRVVGTKGSAAAIMAESQGLAVREVASIADSITLLEAGQADTIVVDLVTAQYYLTTHHLQTLEPSNFILGQGEYAMPMAYNNPLMKKLNISIEKTQDSQLMTLACQKYIGDQAKYCQL